VTHPKQLDSVISTIASTWANNDPMAAIDWLKTLPKTKATLQAASNTAVRMGQTDPLGAIAVLDTLPGNNKANFISNIVTNWANRDFDGAKNWIMQQDDLGKLQQVLPVMPNTARAGINKNPPPSSTSTTQMAQSPLWSSAPARD